MMTNLPQSSLLLLQLLSRTSEATLFYNLANPGLELKQQILVHILPA